MRVSSPILTALRTAGLLGTTVALAGALTACGTETMALDYVPPTMAPKQTVDEACLLVGEEVDRITLETEQQIKRGIDQAAADLAEGKMPSLDFVSTSVDGVLAEVQEQVANSEVAAAVTEVRGSLQAFSEIAKPDTLLGVPGYISAFTADLTDLIEAGNRLQGLCGLDATITPN